MLGVYDEYNIEESDDERTFFGSSCQTEDVEEISKSDIEYWQAVLILIDDWGSYLRIKKLYINATYPETRHKVWPVVQEKFDGSLKNLKSRENELSDNVDNALLMFEKVSLEFHKWTPDRNWLFNNLRDGKSIDRIRQKVKRRIKSGKPADSLKNLI